MAVLQAAFPAGSSPLTRGKEFFRWETQKNTRIIPAYAGKSSLKAVPGGLHKDHPRLRGEKIPAGSLIVYLSGSSPLTRGKGNRTKHRVGAKRIIPAYAGKSRLFLFVFLFF